MSAKRRLPVLQTPPEDDVKPRPPWQWSIFGAGLIVLVWLVLALLTSPLSKVILRANLGPWNSPDELALRLADASSDVLARMTFENVLLQVTVLAVASFAGGFVVGTWGPRKGIAEAAVAGAIVAAGSVVLAALTGGGAATEASGVLVWASVLLIPCASGMAALGALRGSRKKRVLVGP